MSNAHTKTACIIIIGNEILTGRTQDANIAYIGKSLMAAGIKLMQARVIPDIESEIIENINSCRAWYDYVFTSGGIGPTHDDITSECVAKAFGLKHVMNKEALARLVKHYGGEEYLNEGRLRMAMMPEGAALIDNPVSTAPGIHVENVYVMAGVPRIMQAMLDGILPKLQGGPPIKSRTVNCFVPESVIASELRKIAETYSDLDIGSYPYFRLGGFGLSLVVRGTDEKRIAAAIEALCALIRSHGDQPVLPEEA